MVLFEKILLMVWKKYRKTFMCKQSDKHYLVRIIKIIDTSNFSTPIIWMMQFNLYKVSEMVHHTLSMPIIKIADERYEINSLE